VAELANVAELAKGSTTMHELMTIDEVAAYLRVSVMTVRWLRQEGRFAPAVKVGRRLLWERPTVTEWVAINREAAA
jgi:excisionase family DNA binding protein